MLAGAPFIVVSLVIVPEFRVGLYAWFTVSVVVLLLMVGALACWRFPHRLPEWFWVAVPVLCAAAIAWMDLATKDPGVTGLLFFLWPVLYAATFLRRTL